MRTEKRNKTLVTTPLRNQPASKVASTTNPHKINNSTSLEAVGKNSHDEMIPQNTDTSQDIMQPPHEKREQETDTRGIAANAQRVN